nr:hypothetical protein [Actinacidiphila acididurans]
MTGGPPIPVGTAVRDTARDRIGLVMGQEGPYFQLRPLGGGREWDAVPERVEPVGPGELPPARLAGANSHNCQGTSG